MGICLQNIFEYQFFANYSDIELVFSSSNSLNSVPHREIFLAGHSLTLDNVSTYLEGAAGSLGGLGGTEKELLLVSFGTSYLDTLEKTLGEIYRYMEEQFPDYVVEDAFTSQMIIDRLRKRDGIFVFYKQKPPQANYCLRR